MLTDAVRLFRGGAPRARALRSLPGVRWVERNHVFRASGPAFRPPNDPLYRRQWSLRGPLGLAAPCAWWVATGGAVTVAVLDSGVRAAHPDLARNLWTNRGEVPDNGIDDDGNGFFDDVHGADVVDGDGDPRDGLGHGTAVAGVIGARGGNARGIAGVAWRVRLLPVRVLDDHGVGSTLTLLEGLRYAVAAGARIVNMSVNGPDRSRALEEAVAEAARQGVTIVTSAGNDGTDRDVLPSYPASIDSDALLTVAASDASGFLAHGSAYGAVSVDLSAPGENVLTTVPGGRYGLYSGTSFAAAHVTGALALLAAARPDADAPTLRAALLAGARRGTPLADQVVAGELNAGRAMRALVPRRG